MANGRRHPHCDAVVMRALTATLALASLLSASSVAFADPSAAPSSPDKHWYGGETLATDGAALLLLIPALASKDGGAQSMFAVGSVATFGLGAPVVHVAHGRIGTALGDLAMRVVLPLGLGVLGGYLGSAGYQPSQTCTASSDEYCTRQQDYGRLGATLSGLFLGGLLGAGTATVVDAAVLAWAPVHPTPDVRAAPYPPPRPALHVEPTVSVAPERAGGTRATLGVMGTF